MLEFDKAKVFPANNTLVISSDLHLQRLNHIWEKYSRDGLRVAQAAVTEH